jgi:hypothetical protein
VLHVEGKDNAQQTAFGAFVSACTLLERKLPRGDLTDSTTSNQSEIRMNMERHRTSCLDRQVLYEQKLTHVSFSKHTQVVLSINLDSRLC